MKIIWTLCALIGCIAIAKTTQANELTPFKTDGCSLWMDGPPLYPNLWRHCCVAHDLAYWQGGSENQRTLADNAIQACVLSAAESKGMANYMHGMIRWGGSPYWMNYYRWSYGWNYWDGFMNPRGYKKPSVKEQMKINALMPAAIHVITEDAKENPPTKIIETIEKSLKKSM